MPEELRHLIPKNRVIYRLPNCEGYYGFTDKGTRVEEVIFTGCAEDVVTQTYDELGVSSWYSRFWQDIRDAYPQEFDQLGKGKSTNEIKHEHFDEVIDIRNRYLTEYIGFTEQYSPEYFDLDVTGVEGVKSALLRSFRKGIALYDAYDYLTYLQKAGNINNVEHGELGRWLRDKFDNYDLDKFEKYISKVAEVQDSDNEEEDEEDIMSSTKITATTSAGTPKNPVIYKCIDGYYEGYTNNGNKVEDEDWEYCGRDIVIQNYVESGKDYNDAYSQFWLDIREQYPDWFAQICSLYGDVDFENLATDSVFNDVLGSDDLHELCYSYLHDDIGFRTELNPEQFPADIKSESELQGILRELMLAGANEDILDEYIKRLHYVNHVLDWGEYMSISTWLGQKFNTRNFSNKIADIARDMHDFEEEDDLMNSTKIKENKVMGRKFTKQPRYFANMVSADTDMSDDRLIGIVDGDGMDGYVYIIKTTAPESRLSELEQECSYCDYDDMPDWAEVLTGEGYTYTYVDECRHVTPYGTSEEWLEDKYPGVTEMYYIDCD